MFFRSFTTMDFSSMWFGRAPTSSQGLWRPRLRLSQHFPLVPDCTFVSHQFMVQCLGSLWNPTSMSVLTAVLGSKFDFCRGPTSVLTDSKKRQRARCQSESEPLARAIQGNEPSIAIHEQHHLDCTDRPSSSAAGGLRRQQTLHVEMVSNLSD